MDLLTLIKFSLIAILIIMAFAMNRSRDTILFGFGKLVDNITSKRFIVMMIATWFVYRGINIDGNWLLLAAFYIGVDTAANHDLFAAVGEYLRNKKKTDPGSKPAGLTEEIKEV